MIGPKVSIIHRFLCVTSSLQVVDCLLPLIGVKPIYNRLEVTLQGCSVY